MGYRKLTILLSLLLINDVSAQILECINAAGKKEFAQTCPAGTVRQKEMAGSSATKLTENFDRNSDSPKSSNQMELEFQQRRIAREQQEEKLENDKKNKQYKCAVLKERLNMYENSRGIKKYDQASGKWIIVEDEQRPAIIAQIRNDLSQCR